MNFRIERRDRAGCILAILACVAWVLLATAVQVCAGTDFSFLVIGDTRTEPYLTGGSEQAEAMTAVLKKRYHNRPVRLFFDPSGLELEQAEIQERKDSTITLHYRDGWPHYIVRTRNGRSRVIMREAGRKWVNDRVISTIGRGAVDPAKGALFLVHGGDIPLFGLQGKTLDESPYWQLFDQELLSRLPSTDKNLGLPGRVLAAVGNHATWGDREISGVLTTMPWLKDLGLSKEWRIYSITFRNCLFIFLDSGGSGAYVEGWTSQYPNFEVQMDFLTRELTSAKSMGADHVFIVYHKPSFVKVGHDPLPSNQNPHRFIRKFANDLNIFVFNSHTHTTEHYLVDGVHYLVIGAGGAPQAYNPTANPSPEKELYWQGQSRVEEYNYLEVQVESSHIKGMIHRFRPTETERPMGVVEIFRK